MSRGVRCPQRCPYTDRKAALRDRAMRAGRDAHVVFAADKISKALGLRLRWARRDDPAPSRGIARRLNHYEHSLHALQAAAPDLVLTRLRAFELWALRTLPPCQSVPSDRRS